MDEFRSHKQAGKDHRRSKARHGAAGARAAAAKVSGGRGGGGGRGGARGGQGGGGRGKKSRPAAKGGKVSESNAWRFEQGSDEEETEVDFDQGADINQLLEEQSGSSYSVRYPWRPAPIQKGGEDFGRLAATLAVLTPGERLQLDESLFLNADEVAELKFQKRGIPVEQSTQPQSQPEAALAPATMMADAAVASNDRRESRVSEMQGGSSDAPTAADAPPAAAAAIATPEPGPGRGRGRGRGGGSGSANSHTTSTPSTAAVGAGDGVGTGRGRGRGRGRGAVVAPFGRGAGTTAQASPPPTNTVDTSVPAPLPTAAATADTQSTADVDSFLDSL